MLALKRAAVIFTRKKSMYHNDYLLNDKPMSVGWSIHFKTYCSAIKIYIRL